MKKLLAMILAVLLLASLVACGNKEDASTTDDNAAVSDEVLADGYLLYDVGEDGNYEVVGYTYTGIEMQDVEIPEVLGEDERPVTAIAEKAFDSKHNIQSVTIPESVVSIGAHAFYDCDSITEIEVPASVVKIGNGAFEHCSSLTTVTLNKGLLDIEIAAFANCAVLTGVVLPEGLLTIGGGAFRECNALTEITIPSSVIHLGDAAFYGCDKLAKVTMKDETAALLTKMNDALAAETTAPATFEEVLAVLEAAEIEVEGLAEVGWRFSWDKENNRIVKTDDAVLAAMNSVLKEYAEKNNGKGPETFQQVKFELEAKGIYMGDATSNGCKYVWVESANALLGAINDADAALLVKLNAALAENVPGSFDEVPLIIADAELEMAGLNLSTISTKFVWNATTNEMQSIFLGSAVFGNCALDLKVDVTPDTLIAKYMDAEGYELVA